MRREWWWNVTNWEDAKKDQRGEVKEERLEFNRGPGTGSPSVAAPQCSPAVAAQRETGRRGAHCGKLQLQFKQGMFDS